jgi:hypothetical protein
MGLCAVHPARWAAEEATLARKSFTSVSRRTSPWIIPMIYAGASICFGIVFLRFENAYLPPQTYPFSGWFFSSVAISSAQAFLGAIASRMLALTAIVFHCCLHHRPVQFGGLLSASGFSLLFVIPLFHTFGLFNPPSSFQ